MIKPINNYVLIEPIIHDEYVQSDKATYDEVGIVIDYDMQIGDGIPPSIAVGDKVYFDSWQAAKFPKNATKNYWLVPFSSIKAYEISE